MWLHSVPWDRPSPLWAQSTLPSVLGSHRSVTKGSIWLTAAKALKTKKKKQPRVRPRGYKLSWGPREHVKIARARQKNIRAPRASISTTITDATPQLPCSTLAAAEGGKSPMGMPLSWALNRDTENRLYSPRPATAPNAEWA